MFRISPILRTDSYKASHFLQYPPNTTGMYSYLESRGGRYGRTVYFGLQYLLKEYFEGSVVTPGDVEIAKQFFEAHGEPFPYEGWMRIATKLGGRLPVRIKAVPEGTVVPTHNVLMTVESTDPSTDPSTFWVASWLETQIVRNGWYPITVATQDWHIKKIILEYLMETANDPLGELPFKLHDFGARGVSSPESAGIGGMAHLTQFKGSDTVEGVLFANRFYHCLMAGFSIPAAEHSTITIWGREHETEAYQNMLRHFAKPGKLLACVSDSYDIWNAVENIWGDELRDAVQTSGATVVVRPDSGNPPEVVLKCLQILERKVGMEKNLRGYKVLPSYFRLIQGDGVNEDSIAEILSVMKTHGYSASNIAFGCGGALLQKLDRDTQKFAFKCSEGTVDGLPRDVFKDPVTDAGKRSKAGRMSLVMRNGAFETIHGEVNDSLLVPVFENGQLLVDHKLEDIRRRSDIALM